MPQYISDFRFWTQPFAKGWVETVMLPINRRLFLNSTVIILKTGFDWKFPKF